jgi:hypothetical protein
MQEWFILAEDYILRLGRTPLLVTFDWLICLQTATRRARHLSDFGIDNNGHIIVM